MQGDKLGAEEKNGQTLCSKRGRVNRGDAWMARL